MADLAVISIASIIVVIISFLSPMVKLSSFIKQCAKKAAFESMITWKIENKV
jgi:hypothetical protein